MAKDSRYQKLEMFKNTSKTYELNFKEDGVAVDITDWTIYFTVKEKMSDSDEDAKIAKTVTSHSNATAGETLIQLTPSDTNLTPGKYYFSIDYKDDSTPVNEGVVVWGHIEIEDSVLDDRS